VPGMFGRKAAHAWFAVTALVALVGLVIQIALTAGDGTGRFASPASRVGNLFCFFTIDSNLLVGVTCLLLALNLSHPAAMFRVLRLDGVVGIVVTGVVFQVALAGLHHLTGTAALADTLLHKVSPILCLLGWLLFGPRGALTAKIAGWALLFPLAWLAVTLIRGAIIDYYPYPFVDAATLGYGRVALNCLLIAVLFTALSFGALGLDRALAKRAR
jgi:hypothetical protein